MSPIMRHGYCMIHRASCIMHHASCIMHHASCIMHEKKIWTVPLILQFNLSANTADAADALMLLMHHASCIMHHVSCHMTHGAWGVPCVPCVMCHVSKIRVFWQIGVFTKYRCFNAPKWPQMPHKWVNTIPFGSGHTLGTLNHGLGSLFCCFITLFGAGGILDPPGTPWHPLAPPWTPWGPNDPWYVILGYSQSSWVIMSHIWPIWSE